MSPYHIEISDSSGAALIDHDFLKLVVCRVLGEEGIAGANLSVALVKDSEIHEVNRRFLGHDYPTDVISFRFDEPSKSNREPKVRLKKFNGDQATAKILTNNSLRLDGELIISFETAVREAGAHGWSPEAELLLYIVHGMLHMCGYDDLTDDARSVMRAREKELLAIWGFCPTGLEP